MRKLLSHLDGHERYLRGRTHMYFDNVCSRAVHMPQGSYFKVKIREAGEDRERIISRMLYLESGYLWAWGRFVRIGNNLYVIMLQTGWMYNVNRI